MRRAVRSSWAPAVCGARQPRLRTPPCLFPAFPIHWTAASRSSRPATNGPKVPCGSAARKDMLFSDVPGNAIFSWDGKRTTVFLAPSGYRNFPIPSSFREAGSNGLALGRGGLLLADSGTRVIARVDLATRQKTVLAE